MVKDDAQAQELAEAILREKSFKLMRAECNVEGDCRLASGATVMMKYVGQPFDGEYITHAVIHRFSLEEGYITNFFLKRNMVDEEYMKGPTHVDMHSGKSPAAGKKAAAEEYEDNYGEEEETEDGPEFRTLVWKQGSKRITEALVDDKVSLYCEVKNISDGETVAFKIYKDGEDDLVGEVTGRVKDGEAQATWTVTGGEDGSGAGRYCFTVTYNGVESNDSAVLETPEAEVEEEPAPEEPARRSVIHITPHFNQQGTAYRGTIAAPARQNWGRPNVNIPGLRLANGNPGTVARFGCAIALVANIGFTHGSQTITPYTIATNRSTRARTPNPERDNPNNERYRYFDGSGNIFWAEPLRTLGFAFADPVINAVTDSNLSVRVFNDLMDHQTRRHYVAIRVFVTGAAGTRPANNVTGQHWVGASELVTRPATGTNIDTEFFRISPTSENDWELGTSVVDNVNDRRVRGWQIDGDNIFVPRTEVVGYRVFIVPQD